MKAPATGGQAKPGSPKDTGAAQRERGAALADLEKVRYALMRVGANSPVNLRDHLGEDTAAWRAIARIRAVPDYSLRRVVVVGWIDRAIDQLDEDGSAAHEGRAESEPIGTALRQLTSDGITKSQHLLNYLRDNPNADRTPPQDLLYGEYSRQFATDLDLLVEPRTFSTRREAGVYLADLLRPVRNRVMNDAGVWSWLGMYFLTSTAPEALSPNNMTLIFESGEDTSNAGRSEQQTYRHYLWGSWRLYEQQGEKAAFLLDQAIHSWDDLSQRTFGSTCVFSSVGMVEVMLRLYTDGTRKKRGYVHSPGGLRHLLRVLPQLELTYDVYGMEAEAVLRILPAPFRRWDGGTG